MKLTEAQATVAANKWLPVNDLVKVLHSADDNYVVVSIAGRQALKGGSE
ncbi:hypothetical protein NJB95_07165 [Brucella intermedia]|nr:hypothetical protein [Brucella intermedia]MCO7736390.1 hypothetical protein [Brucella intermedia]WLF99064.1 hypothetical protein Q5698_15220 [Brucella intermedia]